MNPGLARLQAYPFERLRALLAPVRPAALPPIPLSLGEPRHAAAEFLVAALTDPVAVRASLATYPVTRGSDALRGAIAAWLARRYGLAAGAISADQHVLPVNGTREALFSVVQALVDPHAGSVVAMPNPFYQIYEGAALLAGAEPAYMRCEAGAGFLPDPTSVLPAQWRRCAVIFVCSPGNPAGNVLGLDDWRAVLELADRSNAVVVADECYSEIHHDEAAPPLGLLEACQRLGRHGFERCLVFHSLSKRSNLPGLRSGFVAGDADLIARFLAYRTYHGCAMPALVQHVSTLAWQDEQHVVANRALYRAKFDRLRALLAPVLPVRIPAGGFYFWPAVGSGGQPGDDEAFARHLVEQANVTVLPGRYLGRAVGGGNPGAGHVRMALVATLDDCVQAAGRIVQVLGGAQQGT